MKRNLQYIIILSIALCFLCTSTFSQKLTRNEKDEFTNHYIKETSWEALLPMTMQNVHFRVRKIDEVYFFELKWMGGGMDVTSIHTGDELMFKLSNQEIIKLKSIENNISCIGCGAVGFAGSKALGINATYSISKDDIDKISNQSIIKLRLYTSDGYLEKEMKEKFSDNIKNSLSLIK